MHHPLPIPLEGLSARGFGRRGVSDGAIVKRRSGGFYHGVALVILRMKEEKMDYLLIVLKTGTYMYLTTLLDPSSCTLSK